MPTSPAGPGITRFDFEDRKGYMVRIRRHGEQWNEYFSDKVYGGKRKTLVVAQARYQELSEQLGPVENATKNLLTHRNSSGKVGVHIAHSRDKRWPGSEQTSYCASWRSADGVRGKISFSLTKYGKKRAWELACLARDLESTDREKVEALYDRKNAKQQASVSKKTGQAKTAQAKAATKRVTKAVSAKGAKGAKSAKASKAKTPTKASKK